MFCCTLLYVHSSIAIILTGKRELIALLNLSSWCLVMVEGLFLTVPRGCLQFVIVVIPDHTHYFCMVRSARKILMNVGSLPLNQSLWISFKMPYLHVVSYAFSKSKNTATTCSFLIKASRMKVSNLTKLSVVCLFGS